MTVQRSNGLAIVLIFAHLVTLAVIWVLPLYIVWHVLLKLLILASLLGSLRRAGWLGSAEYPFTVRLSSASRGDGPDRVDITDAAGKVSQGDVLEGSLVLPSLVILRCRLDGLSPWRRVRSWMLLPDSIVPDAHRRLRVRLRWGRARPV